MYSFVIHPDKELSIIPPTQISQIHNYSVDVSSGQVTTTAVVEELYIEEPILIEDVRMYYTLSRFGKFCAISCMLILLATFVVSGYISGDIISKSI